MEAISFSGLVRPRISSALRIYIRARSANHQVSSRPINDAWMMVSIQYVEHVVKIAFLHGLTGAMCDRVVCISALFLY